MSPGLQRRQRWMGAPPPPPSRAPLRPPPCSPGCARRTRRGISGAGTGPRRLGVQQLRLSHLRRGVRDSDPAAPPSCLGAGEGCSQSGALGVPAALKSELYIAAGLCAVASPCTTTVKRVRGIPLYSRLEEKAERVPALLMPGNGEVPRAELGRRLLGSDVGRTRPLCHPDNYSTMQHPLHLSHFSFPLATACPLASVL